MTVNAGTKCLSIMSKHYFHNIQVTRAENLGYFYSVNLSAPSADIQLNVLVNIHEMIATENIEGLQVRVITDVLNTGVSIHPHIIMYADYFLFVIDDISKVWFI